MSKEVLIVRAPWMHPSLDERTPAGVRFFNPGLAEGRSGAQAPAEFYTPETLPMSFAQARRYVQDALAYGERFPTIGDIAGQGARPEDEFSSGMRANIRAEVAELAMLAGGEPEPKPAQAPAEDLNPRASQMTLLLAWTLEERMLELAELADGLAASSQRFDSALGLHEQADQESEDEEPGPPPAAGLGQASELVSERDQAMADFPWRRSLEHMATFLPDEARLFCCEPFIREAWEANGAVLELAKPTPDLPAWAQELAAEGRLWVTSAELWRLAGMKRAPQGRPWLERVLTAYYRQPEQQL